MPDLRRAGRALGVGVLVGGALCACTTARASTAHKAVPAVSVTAAPTAGAPKTMTLAADAARRLELTTEKVADPTALPWSAVVYDKKGNPWVYTSPRELTFVRVPVTIDRIEGDIARLSAGPAAGTVVVTKSAIKLYGAETGVGGGH